jgi:Secretion system C-terminal sorting domain
MKNIQYISLFIVSILVNKAMSQPNIDGKSDYNWLAGYEDVSLNPNSVAFDFNFKPTKISPIQRGIQAIDFTFSSISDKDGRLLLYTNGCAIIDSKHKSVKNGDTINFGRSYLNVCPGGYAVPQGTLFLQYPQDTNKFILLHQFKDTSKTYIPLLQKNLRVSIINRTANTLVCTTRDSIMLNDTLDGGMMAASRHANGRDWWIIVTELYSNKRYVSLLSPKGINLVKSQKIGDSAYYLEDGGGQAVFSPDGSKYVRYNFLSDIQIFDFDRCSGTLSNFKHIPIQDNADTSWGAGTAISPNSRYLYVTSSKDIYQFDLKSPNIAASKITVAQWDGTLSDINTQLLFYTAQLGADGKIYVSCTGGVTYYHIIHTPDSAGLACNVQQAIRLPIPVTSSASNFPNFRLGSLKGSPCDTLTTPTQEITKIGQLKIYPNPATNLLKIDMTLDDYGELEKCQLRVVNIVGKAHQTHLLSNFASIKEISVADLANGLYFVQLVDNKGQILANSKIVVFR